MDNGMILTGGKGNSAEDIRMARVKLFENDQNNPQHLKLIEKEIEFRIRDSRRQIFELGGLFHRAKKMLGHGRFQKWLEQFDFSYQTANNFMNVYLRCCGHPEVLDYLKPSVLYRLSAPNFNDDLREYILEKLPDIDAGALNVEAILAVNRQVKDQEITLDSPIVDEVLGYSKKRDQYEEYLAEIKACFDALEKMEETLESMIRKVRWPNFPKGGKVLLTESAAMRLNCTVRKLTAMIESLRPDFTEVEEGDLMPKFNLPVSSETDED